MFLVSLTKKYRMHNLALFLLFFVSCIAWGQPADMSIQGAGRLSYIVDIHFGTHTRQAGSVQTQSLEILFNTAFIKVYQKGKGPNNFLIIRRADGQRRNFVDFFGHHFEITDVKNPYMGCRVKYLDEYKQILGYRCQKAILYWPKGETTAFVYRASDLSYPPIFKGLAFEYTVPTSYGQRHYKLSEVDLRRYVSKEDFNTKGYEPILQAELVERLKAR